MKKVMRKIIIILILAGAAAAVFFAVRAVKAKNHAPIVSYSTYYGGDMNGSHHNIEIKKVDDERAYLMTSDASWHFMDSVICEYYVPVSVLKDVENVFDECGMYAYGDLPENPVFALDAGTSSYSFAYEDGDYVSFSENDLIPGKGNDGLRKISSIIADAIASAEKMPGLVVSESEEYYGPRIPEGTVALQVYEYCGMELCFRLVNGTDSDITVTGCPVISKLTGDTRSEIFNYGEDLELFVYNNYENEDRLKLDERLEPGTYVLSFGDYESEFEIK